MKKKACQLAALLVFLLSSAAFGQVQVVAVAERSQAELDQMLAPIALYPDTILSHILIAATYPLEVVQADRWARENKDLSADEVLLAAELKDWDPSVVALVAFPDILDKMSSELEWTSDLGDAFLQDEARVLQRVQDLRLYAHKAGNLDSLDHLKVTKEKTTIIIEPADPEVVYVPYYDTRAVYGTWWWPNYPPVYWAHRPYYRHSQHFYWSPSIYISAGFYFTSIHWRNRHIVALPYARHRDYRFRSGRQVVRHADSRRWAHNPRHRRGVDYRHERVRNRYAGEHYRSRDHQRGARDQLVSRERGREGKGEQYRRGRSEDVRRSRHNDTARVGKPGVRREHSPRRSHAVSRSTNREVSTRHSSDREVSHRRTSDARRRDGADDRNPRRIAASGSAAPQRARSGQEGGSGQVRQRDGVKFQDNPALRRRAERTSTSTHQTRSRPRNVNGHQRRERSGNNSKRSERRSSRDSR